MNFAFGPDYLQLPRSATTWIVQDLLPVGGSLNIYGKPKTGKSLVSLQMAAAIGNPLATEFMDGFPILTHGTVLYLQVDTPRSIWTYDVEKAVSHGYNYDQVAFIDKEFDDIPLPFMFTGTGGSWLREKAILPLKPIVVFIDTIRKTHLGDEDDSTVMTQVLSAIDRSCAPAAKVIISHQRKGSKEWPDELMDGNRGSNALAGEMDVVMQVTKKQIVYEGRTTPERRLLCKRTSDGMWELNGDAIHIKCKELCNKMKGDSTQNIATALTEETGISLETARGRVRRMLETR